MNYKRRSFLKGLLGAAALPIAAKLPAIPVMPGKAELVSEDLPICIQYLYRSDRRCWTGFARWTFRGNDYDLADLYGSEEEAREKFPKRLKVVIGRSRADER